MKTLLLLLLTLASAVAVTLEWDAPTQNQDIVGYKVKWGLISQMPTNETDAGLQLQVTIPDDNFVQGTTYFFVAVSYNATGIESAFSNEVQWTRPMPTPTPTPTPSPTPQPPENLRIKLSVVNGSGDGEYEVGQVVRVRADRPPHRYVFSRWLGDWVILANPFAPRTTATIPSIDVLIQATYERR